MTVNCPTCGQRIEGKRLVVDTERHAMAVEQHTVRLSPLEAKLASALAKSYPAGLAHEVIIAELWGNNSTNDWNKKAVSVFVSKLRGKLAHTRLRLVKVWGRGYAFEWTDTQ